ncbi:hypothetical protein AX17_006829 [Amanita inopinata Kibby_2008]|nr:hypothetical protein AX17_006829 [Amanita inopinata Kibby_2008]
MKGCLKQMSPLPTPREVDDTHTRKCVAFEADGSEQIFVADEWDRTPMEPSRKLSYLDLLELKEIQRSLPLANQPPDPALGRPGRQYLSTVPIGLLPLLPQADTGSNSIPPLQPQVSPTNYNLGLTSLLFQRNIIAAKSRASLQSAHLPFTNTSNPAAQRPKCRFTFLPLLDTPTSSETNTPLASNSSSRSTSPDLASDTDQSLDPPTPSLTNASLDSSPISRASSLSPEPSVLQLSPNHWPSADETRHLHHFGPRDSYFPLYVGEANFDGARVGGLPLDSHFANSTHKNHIRYPQFHSSPSNGSVHVSGGAVPKPARKRNVIVVNDMEIELDDDDQDDEPTPDKPPPSSSISGDLDLQMRAMSINDFKGPNAGESVRPPEGKHQNDSDPAPPSSFASAQPTDGFGSLHTPLRFKRGEAAAVASDH